MPRVGDVFQLLSGTLGVPNTTIQSAPYNAQQQDWVTEANSPRPVSAGGTGETTAAEARASLGAFGADDLIAADTKAAPVDTDSVVLIDSEWAGESGEEDDTTKYKRWLVSDLTTYMRTISPPTGLNRNRLVNGAMQISQENATTTQTISGRYPADQWMISHTGLTGSIQVTRQVATNDAPYSLQVLTTSNQPTVSSGYWTLMQTIEGIRTADFNWGFSTGSPAVLRVRVYTNTAGTYGFFIRNAPTTHTYVGTFTIAAEEVGEVVEKVIAIPAPPAGSTWATTTAGGITVGFTMAVAATGLAATPGWKVSGSVIGVTGQMNFIGTSGNEIAFSAVGLYLDPDNTGVAPKWEMPDVAEELRACQRYWRTNPGTWCKASNSTLAYARGYFSPDMRANPTMAFVTDGTNALEDPGQSFKTVTALGGVTGANGNLSISLTTSTLTVAAMYALVAGRIAMSARL